MTFHVEFFANQLFLNSVKKNIEKGSIDLHLDYEIELVSISIITLIAGFESTLNLVGFYIDNSMFDINAFLKLSRASKIKKLISLKTDSNDKEIIYSDAIIKLIAYRNTLVHFKSPYIGLLGLEDYVNVDIYPLAEMRPEDLTISFLDSAYSEVLKLLREIIVNLPLTPEATSHFDYLYTEDYKILLVG